MLDKWIGTEPAWYELENRGEKALEIRKNIEQNLVKKHGVNNIQVVYQTFYTTTPKEGKKPRIIVCYIRNNTAFAVGFAICSFGDEPNKQIGQALALSRAEKAMREECDLFPVNLSHVSVTFLCSDFDCRNIPHYKGMFRQVVFPRVPLRELIT